jgi:ABC-2 type transport system permease protein
MNTPHTLVAVAWRELTKIAADRWTLMAVTIAPLVAGIVLALIYVNGVVRDIPTMVVDRDHTAASRAFTRALEVHESLHLVRVLESEEEGEASIRSGEAACVVVLPAGFERNLMRGERSPVLCFLNGSNMVFPITRLRRFQQQSQPPRQESRLIRWKKPVRPLRLQWNGTVQSA